MGTDQNLGATTAAILALKNPSIRFTVVDNNTERIRTWKSKKIPVQEPGLFEIILKVSDWHVASNCSENVSSELRSGIGGQTGQQDLDPQHDQHIDRKKEPCHVTIPAPNLYFSTDVRGAIDAADMIFITVNTPSKVNTRLSSWSQLTISILT